VPNREVIDGAIWSALAAGTALVAELGGTAIYQGLAPLEADPPFVEFHWQGGGDENLTPSRMVNEVWTVKGVASTLAQANDIADMVDALLNGATLTAAGWVNFWTAREGSMRYVEVDEEGEIVYHVGGMYRVRMGQ
jgi:hypothetical protein